MRPPLLQTAWMNRVVFDPTRHDDHVESFFFKANDPERPRALWVRCTLFSSATEQFAETWAIYFDLETPSAALAQRGRGPIWAVKNRWPLDRLVIDPERSGVGVAECLAEENHSRGLVRGEGGSIAWDLFLDDELGPYRHFPSEWLYRSRLAGTKIVSPHPCARARGELELWHGDGPGSDVTRISLDGWRAMQGHNWGKRHTERYAWSHCNAFESQHERAFFEGFHAKATMAGRTRLVTMARVVIGTEVYRFDTWRNMFSGHGEVTPTSWKLELSGPDGDLRGEIRDVPEHVAGLTYANPRGAPAHCLNSKLSTLELELTPRHGATRTLRSTKAALEVAQLDPNHGVAMLL